MSTSTLTETSESTLPRFATAGVAFITTVASTALLIFLGQYGYFGDELYFLSAGRRMSPSYADQGPLLPLIAHVMDGIAPGSLFALRIPAVLATAGAIVVSAQIAREFGGARTAQLLTATGYATSPFLLAQGAQLSTNVIDIPLWTLITWLLVRWARTRHDALLIWAAVATAAALQVKWLTPFLWLAVGLAVLVSGPRELLRRRALWLSAAVVAVSFVPSLMWQDRNGWPQLSMGDVVAAEGDVVGGRLLFIPTAIFVAGVLGGVLLLCGVWALLRFEPLREYRYFGLTVLALFVVFLVLGGRAYYVAGAYPVAMAAGAVWLTHDVRRWKQITAVPLVAVSTALAAWSLPWQPERDIAPAPDSEDLTILLYGRFGWPDLNEATARAYRGLSPGERAHAVVIADSYWQASALDNYRGGYLPAVYSPSRGWGYFGAPPDSATTVLFVDQSPDTATTLCAHTQPVGRVDARLGYSGVTKDVTIWKCTGPLLPWSKVWPSLMRMD
ncbi:glycosyltransferase family 39 protein [Mycobacterium sp. NPDC003449]